MARLLWTVFGQVLVISNTFLLRRGPLISQPSRLCTTSHQRAVTVTNKWTRGYNLQGQYRQTSTASAFLPGTEEKSFCDESSLALRHSSEVKTSSHASSYSVLYPQSNSNLEKCILVGVHGTSILGKDSSLSSTDSLEELQQLVKTANLEVSGICVQQLAKPHSSTFVGSGKAQEIMDMVSRSGVSTLVFDDDLTPKQQKGLEEFFSKAKEPIKILDRTAVILDIFAMHANSREAQLQVEMAMLEYRLSRGPSVTGTSHDSGCGFRGVGETKVETDRRVIRDRMAFVRKEIAKLEKHRYQNSSRNKFGVPVIAIVGYTNAGKSMLMNVLNSHSTATSSGAVSERLSDNVFRSEDKLFATLGTTMRRVKLPSSFLHGSDANRNAKLNSHAGRYASVSANVDREVVLPSIAPKVGSDDECAAAQPGRSNIDVVAVDTIGFISKLPASLLLTFSSTLDVIQYADIIVHVIDRHEGSGGSRPSSLWEKRRDVVMQEISRIPKAKNVPIIELWNKLDLFDDPQSVLAEAEAANRMVTTCSDETMNSDLEIPPIDEFPTDNVYEEEGDKGDETPISSGPRITIVPASVRTGLNMDAFLTTLKSIIQDHFMERFSIFLPFDAPDFSMGMNDLYSSALVEVCEYSHAGVTIKGHGTPSFVLKMSKYSID